MTTRAAADALTPETALTAPVGSAVGDLLVVQGNLTEATTRAVLTFARARGVATASNPSPLRPYFTALWPLVDTALGPKGRGDDRRAWGAAHLVPWGGVGGRDSGGGRGCDRRRDCLMANALASALRRNVPLDALALAHGARAAALTNSRAGTARAFPTREEMAAILATP